MSVAGQLDALGLAAVGTAEVQDGLRTGYQVAHAMGAGGAEETAEGGALVRVRGDQDGDAWGRGGWRWRWGGGR